MSAIDLDSGVREGFPAHRKPGGGGSPSSGYEWLIENRNVPDD